MKPSQDDSMESRSRHNLVSFSSLKIAVKKKPHVRTGGFRTEKTPPAFFFGWYCVCVCFFFWQKQPGLPTRMNKTTKILRRSGATKCWPKLLDAALSLLWITCAVLLCFRSFEWCLERFGSWVRGQGEKTYVPHPEGTFSQRKSMGIL